MLQQGHVEKTPAQYYSFVCFFASYCSDLPQNKQFSPYFKTKHIISFTIFPLFTLLTITLCTKVELLAHPLLSYHHPSV